MQRQRKKQADPVHKAMRPRGKSYALALKLEAVRLVLGEGLTQTDAAARLNVTQRCISYWLTKFRAGRLAEEALDCHLPTVPLDQIDEQLRALEAVQAAWRAVFASSDQ